MKPIEFVLCAIAIAFAILGISLQLRMHVRHINAQDAIMRIERKLDQGVIITPP